MKRLLLALAALGAAAGAFAADAADAVRVKGFVTFCGGDRMVIAYDAKPHTAGKLVRLRQADGTRAAGPDRFDIGDRVVVTGAWIGAGRTRELLAGGVVKEGEEELGPPPVPKAADLRRGLLHLRRVRLVGRLGSIETETDATGRVQTYLGLYFPVKSLQSVCVHGDVSRLGLAPGCTVQVDGVAFNVFDEAGVALGAQVEASGADAVRVLAASPAQAWRVAVGLLVALLAVAAAAFAAAWTRARRERARLEIIAKERQRLAAELHDTLEQHFAGAKILIAGALRMKDVPTGAAALLRQAANVMANAKLEVRDAVMDLRSDAALRQSPAEALRSLAAQVTASGATRVRTSLAALPARLGAGVQHDLVSIVREAVTNAVKHGHAKRVVLVADPLRQEGIRDKGLGTRGCQEVPRPFRGEEKIAASAPSPLSLIPSPSFFTLRILNDGEPFDADRVLGPETGHFGLSGMRERAARSGLRLEFFSKDEWVGYLLSLTP